MDVEIPSLLLQTLKVLLGQAQVAFLQSSSLRHALLSPQMNWQLQVSKLPRFRLIIWSSLHISMQQAQFRGHDIHGGSERFLEVSARRRPHPVHGAHYREP